MDKRSIWFRMRNHKVKVLRIITRLNIGGPSIHTTLLTNLLDKNHFESLLVTGSINDDEGDMSYIANNFKFRSVTIPNLKQKIDWKDDLIALVKLYRLIKSEKPLIVHTHTAKAGTLGRIAAFLLGVPVIIHTFHGNVLSGYFGPFKTWFFVWIERILATITNKIIVISKQQKDELCHQLNVVHPHKVELIPLGFDLSSFLNADIHKGKLRTELDINEDTLLVGIVGRLTTIKNHKMFLESAALVLEKRNNVIFFNEGIYFGKKYRPTLPVSTCLFVL